MNPVRTARLLTGTAMAIGATVLVPSALAGHSAPVDVTDGGAARAVVRDVDNGVLGTLAIHGARDGVLIITGRLTGLSPGFHGFHIHAVGTCDPAATDAAGNVVPFASAGGHLNPAGTGHGHHAGDLPVLLVRQDGSARAVAETDAVGFTQLFDADRSAFIVHAASDNYANVPNRYVSGTTNQPGPDAATLATGDAGGRVACGVIAR